MAATASINEQCRPCRIARIDAVDRFGWHIDLARRNDSAHGFAETVSFHEAAAGDYLAGADTRYDAIHDDAWFAHVPSHLQAMISRLKPGGVLTMPNWFLLTDATRDTPSRDWAAFAGPALREATVSTPPPRCTAAGSATSGLYRRAADRLAAHAGTS